MNIVKLIQRQRNDSSLKDDFYQNHVIKWLYLLVLSSTFVLISCQEIPEKHRKPNILFICIDDLRPELHAYGANYIKSPNIDALADKGILFKNHFVNAPSCGPSRYTLLTGRYGPPNNNALFLRAKAIRKDKGRINPSMPEWFKWHGYTTVSVGKVSHHPGGRGGENWNDSTLNEMPNAWDKHLMPVAEWESPKGAMHGLSHGEIRKNSHDMNVFQSSVGDDTIYPDGAITEEALNQLRSLADQKEKPFFLAVGIIKPHLPFGAPKSYFDLYTGVDLPPIPHPNKPQGETTWHGSHEFMQYNHWGKNPNEDSDFADEVRRHYAACVSYADAQVGKILSELKKTGADKNTIVVLWGDHGWHLGEHGIWGKHSLFEESLHAPLIIFSPYEKYKSKSVENIVETLDIFPTLCDLTAVETPNFAQGKSMKGMMDHEVKSNHLAVAYTPKAKSLRTEYYKLIVHNDGFNELYDLKTKQKETQNVADKHPDIVKKLTLMLNDKLSK